MIQIAGILGVFAMVGGGYTWAGGKFGVIFAALGPEMMIIGGSGLMTLVVANDMAGVKSVLSSMGRLFKGAKYKKQDYLDALCLLYTLLRIQKTEAPVVLERHIENPVESPIFKAYPRLLADHHFTAMVCDTLRSISLNMKEPHRVSEMFDAALEKIHVEDLRPAKSLQTMADAFPALGIVAAVLGVIKAMGAITESPEVLGRMIGSALVGTFLGVFLSYGLVGPVASRIKTTIEEDHRLLEVIRAVIVASLEDLSPALCVEIGRQSVPSALQPEFPEVDEALKEASKRARALATGGGATS